VFESGQGERVDLDLSRPVAIASRTDLDGWLLRRATAAGRGHVAERVVEVDAEGGLRTAAGRRVLRPRGRRGRRGQPRAPHVRRRRRRPRG
jgi:hypothetical protein